MALNFSFNDDEAPAALKRMDTLGKNHDATNSRDRILQSSFFKSQEKFLLIRKILMATTLLLTGVGVASAYVDVLDSEADRLESTDFFCEPDMYGWLSLVGYFGFTIFAARRIIKFENSVPDTVLQVEIYQTEDNIYNQKLTKSERISNLLFPVSFSIILGSFSYSLYRVIFEEDRQALLVVNSVLLLIAVVNSFMGRQTVTDWLSVLGVVFAALVLIGLNSVCSLVILDRPIFQEVNWNSEQFPELVYEGLQFLAFFVVSFMIMLALTKLRNACFEAKY